MQIFEEAPTIKSWTVIFNFCSSLVLQSNNKKITERNIRTQYWNIHTNNFIWKMKNINIRRYVEDYFQNKEKILLITSHTGNYSANLTTVSFHPLQYKLLSHTLTLNKHSCSSTAIARSSWYNCFDRIISRVTIRVIDSIRSTLDHLWTITK